MSGSGSFTPEESASRIAGLVLVNAMIFQEVLASLDDRVRPLAKVLREDNPVQAFSDHWQYIVEEIDYYSIFHLAHEVATDLASDADVSRVFQDLAKTAQRIVTNRAALRHDLMGRIYHRLLVEAKYLGTYYTGIPAASLLLALALRPDAWDVDWSDPAAVAELSVADLACGTGTLLMAAADAATDNHVAASAANDTLPRVSELQKCLVEKVLRGYDVLSSAVHLTASTLALRAPEVPFDGMNLWTLPLGGEDNRLGSLEFLARGSVQARLWGALGETTRVRGHEVETMVTTSVPELDLCVMNPPFTRSVGGNLLFGSVPDEQRADLQERLKSLVRSETISANITAGLGSVFVAAAHKHLKPGGRLALVLPKALLSGVAWGKTRHLLGASYAVEYIVCSHDPDRWNFSENTSLSEVLIVARRRKRWSGGETEEQPTEPNDARTVAVNLWHNPTTSFEAMAAAHQAIDGDPPLLENGQSSLNIRMGDNKIGEAVAMRWSILREADRWMLPCAFAQADLARTASHLHRGELWLPGHGVVGNLPLAPLDELGELGPDRRDIYDGFERSNSPTPYPAFWGHDADKVNTVAQEPNAYLDPLPNAKKGRPLREAEVLWPRAGNLLIAERMRLNSQPVAAVQLPGPVLANVWWPVALDREKPQGALNSLALWLNSTLGLVLLLADREETEGPWVQFKKPVLQALPVLDVSRAPTHALDALNAKYSEVCSTPLRPLPEMADDPVRAAIDECLSETFDLPDISILRQMLAREPVISLRGLGGS